MFRSYTLLLALAVLLSACAGVRKQDLQAWVGVPVEALDTHTFFLTLPLIRKVLPSGLEVRNYPNRANMTQCLGDGRVTTSRRGTVTYDDDMQCLSKSVGCDNIFFIRDGKVLEYAPTGSCFTSDAQRPQARYLTLGR
jgi:hypothetical protein